jgi:hemin uptake protein HemP
MTAMTDQHWSSTQDKDQRGVRERGQTESLRRVPLSRILGSDREIVIEFNGSDYRLRITRNQKLILTK